MAENLNSTYTPNAKFILEIDNISIGSFEKVSFGDSEWGVIEGRSGNSPLTKITSSGLKTVTTITLEKQLRDGGAAAVQELVDWHNAGSSDRRSGAVIYLNREDEEIQRISFDYGWVSKVTPPELDASQDNTPLVWSFEISVGSYTVSS